MRGLTGLHKPDVRPPLAEKSAVLRNKGGEGSRLIIGHRAGGILATNFVVSVFPAGGCAGFFGTRTE